ncbi:MAG: hypothetical protein ACP5U2_12540 [Bryobacteraceae bacterium]
MPLAAVEPVRLASREGALLFTLERRFSTLDGERGLRPWVYRVTGRGLAPVWRGTALSWPLVDAAVLPDGTLCALHRTDSFAAPDPGAPAARVAAYRWNGFGFSGVEDARLEQSCRDLFLR